MSSNRVLPLFRALPILVKSKLKHIFAWSWLYSVSLLIVAGGFPPVWPSILSIFSVIFVVSSVYFYNDIIDREMDNENILKKNRPIASGQIKKRDAETIAYLLGSLGLAFAWFVNIFSFSFISLFFIIFFIYSYPKIRLKTRFLGKDFTLFIGMPLLSLAANYAVSNTLSVLAFYNSMLISIFALTAGPVINESSDIIEDKKHGVKSLSTMWNWSTKVQFMILGILSHMVLVPFIQIQFGSNMILPAISIGIMLLFLIFSFPLMKEYSLNEYNKSHKVALIYALMSPIFFLLISFHVPIFFSL